MGKTHKFALLLLHGYLDTILLDVFRIVLQGLTRRRASLKSVKGFQAGLKLNDF